MMFEKIVVMLSKIFVIGAVLCVVLPIVAIALLLLSRQGTFAVMESREIRQRLDANLVRGVSTLDDVQDFLAANGVSQCTTRRENESAVDIIKMRCVITAPTEQSRDDWLNYWMHTIIGSWHYHFEFSFDQSSPYLLRRFQFTKDMSTL